MNSQVCILTAGKGTRMGPLSSVINKALLPIKNKAVISHILDNFPKNTSFVVALGYKGEQVRDYLKIAHPDLNISFVTVDRYEGFGSGPGYSLLCCREHLCKPFYFVSCDTLFNFDMDSISGLDRNWIGVASVPSEQQGSYCNVSIDKEESVTGIYDKYSTNKTSLAFTGLMYVHDTHVFWKGFDNEDFIDNELQISAGLNALLKEKELFSVTIPWVDVGDYEKYKNHREKIDKYDFGKENEFLYFLNGQVIKFFSNADIVSARVKKAKIKPTVFPEITASSNQFYSYKFVQGETLYASNPIALFKKLLYWLEAHVWTQHKVPQDHMSKLCETFYKKKTLLRLDSFNKKYKESDLPLKVNNMEVLPIDEILQRLPWSELCQGIPSFIHGDLQFDNILYDSEEERFVLLDWRQDFSGEVSYGDLYYDFAKLLGGIIINYDYIKQALFTVKDEKENIYIDFAQRYSRDALVQVLKEYLEARGLSYRRVCILTGLIFLNMAPLHTPPFDKMLHGLGRLWLTKVLARARVKV